MSLATQPTLRCAPVDDGGGAPSGKSLGQAGPGVFDDLPFKVELWDERRTGVEIVLAVTASGSIGFAAFHAATREFPDRHIVLRHNESVLARWNNPGH